jgi:hypothetical protein
MEPATQDRRPDAFSAALAGLQAGMLGVCWMLAWLGVTAEWERRSFWTAENLMASVFYGDRAIRAGFAAKTLSGLALYFLLYSSLGAAFAAAVADRVSRFRVVLIGVLAGLLWYYVSFGLLWKNVAPLMTLLHSPQPTALGHVIYGAVLGRYPVYLGKPAPAVASEGAVEAPPEQRAVDGRGESGG